MAGFVELYRLGKTYSTPAGSQIVVENFNLNMEEGEVVSLIGHSGCGKSTVLGMVAGLVSMTAGSVVVARREITGAGPDRGVVFQSPCLLPWLSAVENVLLGVQQVHRQASYAKQIAIAVNYLERVGLGDAIDQRASTLSQGMQQRVGIARAFALEPRMLLLDEPFGMLDSLTRAELQDVLLDILATRPMTTLMVTHDVDEALYMSDRVVMMTNGPNAKVGDVLDVPFAKPRQREYVLGHRDYYPLRDRLLSFLESQDHRRQKPVDAAPITSSEPRTAEPELVQVI